MRRGEQTLADLRTCRSPHAAAPYPDHALYAEFACAALGLGFADIDGGSGLAFAVSGPGGRRVFGGGRASYFPQNDAVAATLAADKYLANAALTAAGVTNLGGDYVFLGERRRAQRRPGHERADAFAMLAACGGRAFVKPLMGSRGDFAQIVASEAALGVYLDAVATAHDAIILQRVVSGDEYRLFVLDGDIVYGARKQAPFVTGDGVTPLRDLIAAQSEILVSQGVSATAGSDTRVPANGELVTLPGRANRSAGGRMTFAMPERADAAVALACAAARALGLRAAGVDLFVDVAGAAGAMAVVELNANPSIRLLEESGRDDLILRIWRANLAAAGVL